MNLRVLEQHEIPSTGRARRPGPLSQARQLPRRTRRLLAAALGAVLVVLIALALVVLRQVTWHTVWSEEFDGAAGSAPSASDWIVDTGTSYPGGAAAWGTGEVETYTDDPANLALDGQGRLRITATKNAAGGWQSGKIETRRTDFQPGPGQVLKVAARLQLPAGGQGYWPAFWMLGEGFRGNPTNWPMAGEIDIMENIGREPATVHGTLHCGTAPGGPCYETNGLTGAHTQPDGTPLSAGFHDYALEWDRSTSPEQLRWYVDGKLFSTVKASDVDAATWAQATHHGYFVLLNLAVGGGWPGAPDATTKTGQSLLVDYVRVSQR